MSEPAAVKINTEEWARFKRELDRFDPALTRALRRRIRDVGQDAVDAVRDAVREPAPTQSGQSRGSREEIARATRLSTSFAVRGAGVKITTGTVRDGFHKAYNQGTFRHPVYGGGWVTQQGRPYFGTAINKTMRTELIKNVRLALDAAVRAIGGKGI